jgi:hypothetical protein
LISYEKKNPTITFIQLLRTKKKIKNKIKNKSNEKKHRERRKKNLTLMQLQVKLRREKKTNS